MKNPKATFSATLGGYEEAISACAKELVEARAGRRLLEKDASLFAGPADKVSDRLGWVDLGTESLAHLPSWKALADKCSALGLRHALLLGMGGSSLCPWVFAEIFGAAPDGFRLIVLDSTAPEAIDAAEKSIDLEKTLFIVSTKSGTTIETMSLCRYFLGRCAEAGMPTPGQHFIAITDPGNSLREIAKKEKFLAVFDGRPDVGGRYSALSVFGLLPGVLLGIDVQALLLGASELAQEVVATPHHDVITLGAGLGTLYRLGRNKLTFVLSERLRPLGVWIEQLVAESSGKLGKGLVPVIDEPLAENGPYGSDRVFVSVRLADEPAPPRLAALAAQNHPLFELVLPSLMALGAEFWRWEAATALACHVLGVNPFDEPNVTEAKEATSRALAEPSRLTITAPSPVLPILGRQLRASAKTKKVQPGLEEAMATLFAEAKPDSYLAILAFLAPTTERKTLLARLHFALAEKLGLATTFGWGPRFLHSTGQLHKGGPRQGLFLQLTQTETRSVPIPGASYGFETLIGAQAQGDFDALDAKKLPLLRLHLEDGSAQTLANACEAIVAACPAYAG